VGSAVEPELQADGRRASHRAARRRERGRAGGAGGDANAAPRANNGLSGNPHFATKEIGKDLAEIGINNTVNQVKRLLAGGK